MPMAKSSILLLSFKVIGIMAAVFVVLVGFDYYQNYGLTLPEIPELVRPQSEQPVASEDTISAVAIGSVNSGIFTWPYSYTVMDDGVLILKIKLTFDEDIDRDEIPAVKRMWKKKIEAIWNNKFVAVNKSGRSLKLRLKIVWGGPNEVYVHQTGKTHFRQWALDGSIGGIAHDVGHMIGLHDEYVGGAVLRSGPITSPDGIMGGGAALSVGKMYPRYYDPWLAWLGSGWTIQVEGKTHANAQGYEAKAVSAQENERRTLARMGFPTAQPITDEEHGWPIASRSGRVR